MDGRKRMNDEFVSARFAPAHRRMTFGANGRADHGSVESNPRSASARAYISHSLPTHVSFQFAPWASANVGAAKRSIASFFITLMVCAVPARSQSTCIAGARQLSTLSPRARLSSVDADGRPDRDVIGDASVCLVQPAALQSIVSGNIAGQPLHIAVQPTIARSAILGGVDDPRDDGPAWNGRGANYFVRTGISADVAWFHAVVAPQFWYAQNKPYEVFALADTSRRGFASPWYSSPNSIDLPSRFGAKAFSEMDLGETALWASVGPVDAGVSSSTQRWGPGERGTLIIGADAPGIPRVFVRTSRPIRTPVGAWSGSWFLGTLTESRFFDDSSDNDRRGISAMNIAWSPSDSSSFVVGLVHAAQRSGSYFSSDSLKKIHGPAQQINEAYAQFRDPVSGIRAWAEVGRAGALPKDRQFFSIPYEGLVYVVGADRALSSRHGTVLVSFEAANLEQPTDVRGAAIQDFYTSANIPQGWSQRGQPLGYSAGPGANTQWLSVDWLARAWSLGAFAERVRWNEDALIRQFLAYPNRHDVTVRGGLRTGVVWRGTEFSLEGSIGHRINYLFQNTTYIPGYRTVDVSIPSLRFAIAPAVSIR